MIDSPRLTDAERRAWHVAERGDVAHAALGRFRRVCDDAKRSLEAFARTDGAGYVGVSWGKDSVVVAHMAVSLGVLMPLVWVQMRPIDNPDCQRVRDAFLAAHPHAYDEVVCWFDPSSRLTSEPGFAEAARRHGDRYVTGIRAAESRQRAMSAAVHGVATLRACRPILRWSARDVFAYLALHDLPVHPAYAMTYSGQLDRDRLRVASVGGERGRGHGRREWEQRYYPEVLRAREAYTAGRLP